MDGQWHSYKKNETWFTDVRRWNPFAPEQNKCFEWDVTPAWRIANRQYEYFSNTFNGLINGEVLTIKILIWLEPQLMSGGCRKEI